MFTNYLKMAYRTLLKQRWLSFINISGLSIGLACFTLFLLYAVHEFSYDRFHKEGDRLYRVYRWTEAMRGEKSEGDPYLPIPLGPALKADFSDIEEAVRMRGAWEKSFVRAEGKVTKLGVSFADEPFFNVLSFPIKYGDPISPLKELNNIVLTENTAKDLFGNADAVGKTIEIKLGNVFEPFVVSAVANDLPSNTSITFEALCTFNKLRTMRNMERRWTNWRHSSYFTFVKLRENSTLTTDAKRLAAFWKKYYPDDEQELRNKGYWKEAGAPITYKLQPLNKIHIQPEVYGGLVAAVEPKTVWILLAIAFGILLIACINFTTLSIGRSAGRAREVGVRKVLGSFRSSIITQYLSESLLMVIVSAGLGLFLAYIALPVFNQLTGKELVFSIQQFPEMVWLFGGLILVTGLLSGIYPALALSGHRPVEILKNKIRLGGANLFTKSLITGQFVVSVAMIIGTIVILKQLHFLRSTPVGFDKENIVVIDASETDSKRVFPLFKQAISSIPEIKGISGSELGLGADQGWSRQGWDYGGSHHEAYEYFVDPEFINVLNLKLIRGRNFQKNISEDTLYSVIINEALMNEFKWTPENAIGQKLMDYSGENSTVHPTVIGVVKNFNFRSLSEGIEPQLFHQFQSYVPFKYFVKLAGGNPQPALQKLKAEWVKLEPTLPFSYSFLDENLAKFYESESRIAQIVSWAGGISIFLSCLGLFGLAVLSVVNRKSEIGIRKVLGASVMNITTLISKDFLQLVFIAIVIAGPIAYYFMNTWLKGFAYRIELEWWMFGIAGMVVVLIACITVGLQAVRAAWMNPVNSIRTE